MRTEHEPLQRSAGGRRAVMAFLAIAGVLWVVSAVASIWLPDPGNQVIPPFRGWRWLQGWAQWDSGWYFAIATGGYGYVPGRQSTIAFFPAYPLAMRAVALAVANAYVAGMVVTVAAGAGAIRLLFGWLSARLTPAGAQAAVALVLLYPYAFFLYGAVYPTALFVLAIVGAFVLLEHGHPWLSGLVGAVATAAQPTGIVLVIALAVRAVERRRDAGEPVWRDAGVLLSALGLVAFCIYQWRRFGDPFTFVTVQSAWDQESGLRTWVKVRFFEDLTTLTDRHVLGSLSYLAHPVLTVGALALVPRVFRRFGYGYGTYALLAVVVPALATKNFFGMARYLLAAFPCFAVLGELLVERPAVRRLALPASGAGLVVLTAIFGTGYYLS